MNENEVTSPVSTLKSQTYLKVGIGASIFLIFVIYRVYIAFSGVEQNTPQSKEDIKIFKNDDMVQTKYMGEIAPDLKNQKTELYDLRKEQAEQTKKIQELQSLLEQQSKNQPKQADPTQGIDFKYSNPNANPLSFPAPGINNQSTNSQFAFPKEEERTYKVENLNESMLFDVKKNDFNTSKKENNVSKKRTLSLAPGVLIKARLITGVRAPTLTKAVNEPQPAFLRVTDLAILPNRGKLNIKECVIRAEARGDLSTESVFIRANYLSCTTNKGEVLVSKLHATVYGKSGTNGIGGVVVSKQGQLLGRSLIAGFVSGFSDVANSQYQNTITSTTGTLTSTNNLSTGDMFKSGAYGGIKTAGNEMSKFYMDMVKQIEPSIEIKANIDVDVMVTEPSEIEFKREDKK